MICIMKRIYLLLLALIFLIASSSSVCGSILDKANSLNVSKIKSIESNEIKSPVFNHNAFLGTLFIMNYNSTLSLKPKHSYINKVEDESPKIKQLCISQEFDLDCDSDCFSDAIYTISLPCDYINSQDKNPTVKYEVKGDGERIILSGSTKMTGVSHSCDLSDPDEFLLKIPGFTINNDKHISINFHLEHPMETITQDTIPPIEHSTEIIQTNTDPPVEKESVPLTTKITVFSLIFIFLNILKFIHEKWRIQK